MEELNNDRKKIKAEEKSVYHFLKNNNFHIPPYQRGYDWDEETSKLLFEDIFNHQKNNDYDYFIGNIIIYPKIFDGDINSKLVVVDGQQRITTLMLMITALRVVIARSNNLSIEEKKSLDKKLKILTINKEEDKVKLNSRRQKQFEEIIEINISEVDSSIDELIEKYKKTKKSKYFTNFILFIKMIGLKLETNQDFINFIENLKSIILVSVNIKIEKNVHVIFEKINSTGANLTLTDLIHNFMYIILESNNSIEKKQKELIEDNISKIFDIEIKKRIKKSDDILSDYLIFLSKEWFKKDDEKYIYRKFKSEVFDLNLDVEILINEIEQQLSLIEYFEKFEVENSTDNYDLSLFLSKEKLNGAIFPFIYFISKNMKIFDKNNNIISNVKNNKDFNEFIILMDKFFARRIIVNATDKNYNKNVGVLIKNFIENIEKNKDKLKVIEKILTNCKDDQVSNSALMDPIDDVVNIFKKESAPYKNKNSSEIKHILFKIEAYYKGASNEGVILTDEFYEKFTIEHIMPQTPDKNSEWIKQRDDFWNSITNQEKEFYDNSNEKLYESWINNWGNITATIDNSKMSNKDFVDENISEDKKSYFSKSLLLMNNEISNNKKWTIEEIQKRNEKLSKIIKEIF